MLGYDEQSMLLSKLAPAVVLEGPKYLRLLLTGKVRLDDLHQLSLMFVIAEILEVANNPNLNKNRGSTVRGDR